MNSDKYLSRTEITVVYFLQSLCFQHSVLVHRFNYNLIIYPARTQMDSNDDLSPCGFPKDCCQTFYENNCSLFICHGPIKRWAPPLVTSWYVTIHMFLLGRPSLVCLHVLPCCRSNPDHLVPKQLSPEKSCLDTCKRQMALL